jgi:hypothetical protein
VTTAPTTDCAATTQRQQCIWSAGDLSRIRPTDLPPGGPLYESLDVLPDERVLDVAAGHGNASLAERIGFWIYVAMGIVGVAILGAAAISAIAS